MSKKERLVAIMGLLAFLCVVGGVSATAGMQEAAEEPPRDAETLDCDLGDLVLEVSLDVTGDVASRPLSPESEKRSFLEREFPQLPQAEFEVMDRGSTSAQFLALINGREMANLNVERIGEHWYAVGFKACNKFLTGEVR